MAQANSNSNKNNNNRKCPPRRRPPPTPGDDVIAGRTRQQKRATVASKWNNLTIPIKIEILSYLDQESLMNLSLVSKQSNHIIRKELGNKNKIIPVFEIGLISMTALCRNLLNHSLNRETNNNLQRYQIMRFKDSYKYTKDETNLSVEAFMELQRETMRKVRFTGIASLDLVGYPFKHRNLHDRLHHNLVIHIISFILPKLREVKFSYMPVSGLTLSNFSMNCPLLEKVTLNNNNAFAVIRLDGFHMRHSNSLKEIYLDSSSFECRLSHRNAIEDLNDQPEVYMFHHCCKALERVSIRNSKLCYEDDRIISQNTLIKFVRNAPLTLRWFRSDLTQ